MPKRLDQIQLAPMTGDGELAAKALDTQKLILGELEPWEKTALRRKLIEARYRDWLMTRPNREK